MKKVTVVFIAIILLIGFVSSCTKDSIEDENKTTIVKKIENITASGKDEEPDRRKGED